MTATIRDFLAWARAFSRDAGDNAETYKDRMVLDRVDVALDADALAADTREDFIAAPDAALGREVKSVTIIPSGAATANDTNYATVTLEKEDGAGGASTTVASITTEVANGSWAAGVKKSLALVAGATSLAAGEVLMLKVAKAASGVALPKFAVSIVMK